MFEIKPKFFNITPEMLAILTEIDEFKGAWRVMDNLAPEYLKALKKIATIESIASSNRIEGNKLTDKEVSEILSNLETTSFKSCDEQEVAGYAKLMDIVFENSDVIPLNENYVKQFHNILLEFTHKDERHRGEYKFDTPEDMKKLIEWTEVNLKDKYYHPLLVIAAFIVTFLAIHPFQDGNGRLSRALTVLLLLKAGYTYAPYSSMEAIIEDNKNGYYRALRQTQITLKKAPDYEPWFMFFLRALQKQKIRLEHKIEGLKEDFMLSIPKLSVDIVKLIEEHKRLTVAEIQTLTKANNATIKKHLKNLVDNGYLQKHGVTKGSWYTIYNKSL